MHRKRPQEQNSKFYLWLKSILGFFVLKYENSRTTFTKTKLLIQKRLWFLFPCNAPYLNIILKVYFPVGFISSVIQILCFSFLFLTYPFSFQSCHSKIQNPPLHVFSLPRDIGPKIYFWKKESHDLSCTLALLPPPFFSPPLPFKYLESLLASSNRWGEGGGRREWGTEILLHFARLRDLGGGLYILQSWMYSVLAKTYPISFFLHIYQNLDFL